MVQYDTILYLFQAECIYNNLVSISLELLQVKPSMGGGRGGP